MIIVSCPNTFSKESANRALNQIISNTIPPLKLTSSITDQGQAIKSYMHGSNKITLYSNTGESLDSNGIKVTLHGRDLWAKFHKSTTEMIITKAGR